MPPRFFLQTQTLSGRIKKVLGLQNQYPPFPREAGLCNPEINAIGFLRAR